MESPAVCCPDPLVQWLLGTGWTIGDPAELIQRFACRLLTEGVPLRQLMVLLSPAQPQLEDVCFTWRRETSEVEARQDLQGVTQLAAGGHERSVVTGSGAARVVDHRPDRAEQVAPDAVPRRLEAHGATDHAAFRTILSDGTVSTIAFVGDGLRGFSDRERNRLDQSVTVLARLLEAHAVRRTARGILETYLGKRTGERILDGRIERGAGDDIHAVIWFCDLRDSTRMADSMTRRSFLATLNEFFDCTAGAVLDHGGEVLRFIGDASLAIFPTGEVVVGDGTRCCDAASACQSALAAAVDARQRMKRLNVTRRQRGDTALRFGLALHMGDVTYGNIGVARRLEFTVVGAAANRAARLEGLCKDLDQQILASAAFDRCFPGKLVSLGYHALRGSDTPEEVFTFPEP